MRNSVVLFMAVLMAKTSSAQIVATSVTGTDGQMTINLGVPMPKQIEYIRELSRFYFSKVRWYRKFRANACPEFEAVVKDVNSFCPLGTMPPLEPLSPFSRCDVNPDLPNCKITTGTGPNGKPTCTEVPERCTPPVYCDWPDNRAKSECLPQPECVPGSTNVLCRVFTKCDLPQWSASQPCIDKRTCSATDTMVCLDICDTPAGINKNECIVQKCDFFPNDPICPKVRDCLPQKVCDGVNSILDPACCSGAFCIYDCKLRSDCPSPPKVCQWGYNLGSAVIGIFDEPVMRKIIDPSGVLEFVDCYTNVTEVKEIKLEMKCFESGIAQGFVALDDALKKKLIEMTQQYQNVTVTGNATYTSYSMQNTTTQKLVAQ